MRILAIFSISFSATVFVSQYFFPGGCPFWIAAACAALGAVLSLVLHGDNRRRAVIISAAVFIGFLWSGLHYKTYISPCEEIVGTTLEISGTVCDYPVELDGYSYVPIKVTDGAPRVKIRLYSYGDISSLKPGDTVRTEAKAVSALTSYEEETDTYTSAGIFMRAYAKSDVETTGRSGAWVLYYPKVICHAINEAVLRFFPEKTAGIISALITGDKAALYEDAELYNAMKIAGIAHSVAVSGMHVAFVVGFFLLLLGRRRGSLFGIPFVWVFAAVTGFGPAVVRAAFMQTVFLVAPLLKRENDTVTSLSAALMLLLCINPCAIASVGLQLSFAAMAGIVAVSPKVYDWLTLPQNGRRKKLGGKRENMLFYGLCASFSSSVGALVFTTPLIAFYFGYVPMYSIVSNLLCLPVMSLMFVLGYAVCAIGLISPTVAVLAGKLSLLPGGYVSIVVKLISKLPLAALYTSNNLAGWWLLFVYIIFGTGYALKGKDKRFRPVVPAVLSACLLAVILAASAAYNRSGAGAITVLDVGQGECVVLFCGDKTVVVDCGGSGKVSAGTTAAGYILGAGRSKVDVLIFTHLHEDHTNGFAELIMNIDVEKLVLPEKADDSDETLSGMLEWAAKYETQVDFIGNDAALSAGNMELRLSASDSDGKDENERGLIVLADYGEFEAVITGDAGAALERRYVESRTLPDAEMLVVGHHGSKTSTSAALLESLKPELAVISVGYNSYGHPAAEVLDRLDGFGMDVYRTDLNGNVTIRIR